MRIGALLVAMLGLMGSAAAEGPRYVPAVGTVLTYRVLTSFGAGTGRDSMTGQMYRLTTAASDGVSAQMTLAPLAMIFRCPQDDISAYCRQAPNFPGAVRDGDLITIPVPLEISSELAKIGWVSSRDFLRYTQVFPVPGAQDVAEIDKPQVGATPLMVLTNGLDCDGAALKGFFPLGSVARVTVPCKLTVEVSQSRIAGVKDRKETNDMSYELSYAGREHIAVAAGEFQVAVIRFKGTTAAETATVTEGESAFSEELGTSVKFSARSHAPNATFSTRIERELIKVEQ